MRLKSCYYFSNDERHLREVVKTQFSGGDLGEKLKIEYIFYKREKAVKENGILKDFAPMAIVGEKKYLAEKSIKMVYMEKKEEALSIITSSLAGKGASVVLVSEDSIFDIDPKYHMLKKDIGILYVSNSDNLKKLGERFSSGSV